MGHSPEDGFYTITNRKPTTTNNYPPIAVVFMYFYSNSYKFHGDSCLKKWRPGSH